jgi:hypothetical protein
MAPPSAGATHGADYNLRISDSSLNVEKFAIRNKARVEFARIGGLAVTARNSISRAGVVVGGVALQQCRAGIARCAGRLELDALLRPTPAAERRQPAPPDPRATPRRRARVAVGQAAEHCAVQFTIGGGRRGEDLDLPRRGSMAGRRARKPARIDLKPG